MDFSDIRDNVSDIIGPSKTLLNRFILGALKDLCSKTWAYTEVLSFLTTAGTREYTLTPTDSDTVIIGIPHNGVQKATINTPQPTASDGTSAGALTPGTTYYYKVTALVNDYRETLPCVAVSYECPATGSIILTWDAISGADGYKIYGRDGTTYLEIDEVTAVTWEDDGSETPAGDILTTSELMKEIGLSNLEAEKQLNITWRSSESDGFNKLIYNGYNKIELDRIPITSGIGVQVRVALEPTKEITIPPVLEQYHISIEDYVRWKLYAMTLTKTATWPDKNYADYYRREYLKERINLKIRVMYGFGGDQRIKPVFFA